MKARAEEEEQCGFFPPSPLVLERVSVVLAQTRNSTAACQKPLNFKLSPEILKHLTSPSHSDEVFDNHDRLTLDIH